MSNGNSSPWEYRDEERVTLHSLAWAVGFVLIKAGMRVCDWSERRRKS